MSDIYFYAYIQATASHSKGPSVTWRFFEHTIHQFQNALQNKLNSVNIANLIPKAEWKCRFYVLFITKTIPIQSIHGEFPAFQGKNMPILFRILNV